MIKNITTDMHTCDLSMAVTSNVAFIIMQWMEMITGALSACANSVLIATLYSTTTIEPFVRVSLVQISACLIAYSLIPMYNNGEVQLVGVILQEPCALKASFINCLTPFSISNGFLSAVSCTMVALTVYLAYKCHRMKLEVVETLNKPKLAWILLFVAMMCGVFVGSYTFGNVMSLNSGWNRNIPICVRQFINGSLSERILMIIPVIFETVTLFLWPYTRRTNKHIHERFRITGYHQTLKVRLSLRRNNEAIRALYPAISFHAFTTIANIGLFLIVAQFMQRNSEAHIDGLINRELLGLVLRTAKCLCDLVHPIILVRQYSAIHNRMHNIMPTMALIIGGRPQRKIAPVAQVDNIRDNAYWLELDQMWKT